MLLKNPLCNNLRIIQIYNIFKLNHKSPSFSIFRKNHPKLQRLQLKNQLSSKLFKFIFFIMTKEVAEMALEDYIKESKKKERQEKNSLKGVKPSKTVLVKNIHLDVTEMELYKAVSEKGTLTECQLKKDQFGRSLGKAKLTFESLE